MKNKGIKLEDSLYQMFEARDDNITSIGYSAFENCTNLEEVISRGAIPIYVGTEDYGYENQIIVPKVHKKLQPLLVVPTLQMIAYYVALKRGCEIDKPRNLAKSVTVE